MPKVFRARVLPAIGTIAIFLTTKLFAAPLPPGGALNPTPGEPDPTGGSVIGTLVKPFATAPGPIAYSGVLTTTIIRNDPSNPFAGIGDPNLAHHGLTFVYELHNDATSIASLARMTNTDFAGFSADASYQTPTAAVRPSTTDRDTLPAGLGSTIGWSFSQLALGKINPGQTSAKLVVQTNAPGFVDVMANLIDANVLQVPTFGPDLTPIVPEPGALTLLLVASAGLAARRRI